MFSINMKQVKFNRLIDYLMLFSICLWMIMPLIYGALTSVDHFDYINVFGKVQYQLGYIALSLALTKFLVKYREDRNFLNSKTILENLQVFIPIFLLIWSFVSALNASDYEISFNGNAYRLEGFLRYISYLGFFFLGHFSKNKKHIKLFMCVFLFSGLVLSSVTFFKFIENEKLRSFQAQVTSVFFNANHYGYYLTMVIICAAGMALLDKNSSIEKIYCLVTFIISSVALIINNTFGSYLAVFFGLIFLIIAFRICKRNVLKKSIYLLMVFMAVSLLFNFKYKVLRENVSQTTSEVKNISKGVKGHTSGMYRWILWKDAVKFTFERPILGYGPDSLEEAYLRENNKISDRPHNTFLQISASLGIPALLMYIAMLTIIYVKSLKIRCEIRSDSLVAICVTVAYLMSSFFGNSMYYTSPYYIIFLGLCSRVVKEES
ncbi:O-antigen ligase [Hathewaya proteolytica DSM 3090]|uniref:O-antigen ligase n=1 Tax=Hathewaya proteolytica DSM 3090 TaxID=1121331 RepID=A0A1M6LIZ0_9CLOT|nr:O-antigen ligase family protein [Hathewaya proteolytica]SHJ71122.1 O-antigen ligase [Hathewaya proteolytica DSM 3090]